MMKLALLLLLPVLLIVVARTCWKMYVPTSPIGKKLALAAFVTGVPAGIDLAFSHAAFEQTRPFFPATISISLLLISALFTLAVMAIKETEAEQR